MFSSFYRWAAFPQALSLLFYFIVSQERKPQTYSNLGHSIGDSFDERTAPLFVLKVLIRARLLLYLCNDCDASGNAPWHARKRAGKNAK